MAERIVYAHGSTDEWALENTPLAVAQPGLDVTTGDVKMGNGNDLWVNLPVAYNIFGSGGPSSIIDDFNTGTISTWSSQKITSSNNDTLVRANAYADQATTQVGGPKWAACLQNSDGSWPASPAGPADSTLYFGTVGVGSPPPGDPTRDLVVLKDAS